MSLAAATAVAADESLVRCCGKFAMLDVLLPALKAAQHRVLVFSQMTKLLDLLEVGQQQQQQ